MTPVEAVKFVKLVNALWPQQRLEEATPDAWYAAGLKDVDWRDAAEAATRLVKTKVFISLAEILTEVKTIRSQRLERAPLPAPSADLTDNQAAYKAALDRSIDQIAGGWDVGPALEARKGAPPTETYIAARGGDPGRNLRVASLPTPCPHCKAAPGDRCVNAAGVPLGTAPAHEARLVAAGLARWVEVRGVRRAELLAGAAA
jgi:hypothetical protein